MEYANNRTDISTHTKNYDAILNVVFCLCCCLYFQRFQFKSKIHTHKNVQRYIHICVHGYICTRSSHFFTHFTTFSSSRIALAFNPEKTGNCSCIMFNRSIQFLQFRLVGAPSSFSKEHVMVDLAF